MLSKNILIFLLCIKEKNSQGTHNHFHINIINTFSTNVDIKKRDPSSNNRKAPLVYTTRYYWEGNKR